VVECTGFEIRRTGSPVPRVRIPLSPPGLTRIGCVTSVLRDLQYIAAMNASNSPCLQATALLNADHPAVAAFAHQHAVGADPRERAIALYLAVRDQIRYDPYRIDLSVEGMRASTVLEQGYGWCVNKAALMVAALRAVGIPARLGHADVRNHMSTERLRKLLNTDVYIWHGYAEIWLGERWVKCTPAFNIELCEKFGIHPLEFDGVNDSIYHPFDKAGNQHMEYVNERGSFDDMPLDQIRADFIKTYPLWLESRQDLEQASFQADAIKE
jgi:transglutaminase-like putative cysteine protease